MLWLPIRPERERETADERRSPPNPSFRSQASVKSPAATYEKRISRFQATTGPKAASAGQ